MAENENNGGLLQGVGRLFLASANLPILALLILFVLGGAVGVYVVRQRPGLFGLSKGQAQLQQEVENLVKEVGKLIALPEDEDPTIATVTDVEAAKDQPFFAKAQNGDKVLIYTNARKAILYRPSENRIIEVGLVNINQQGQAGPEISIRLALYNGTNVVGLTTGIENELIEALENLEIVTRANASRVDYEESIVIDLTGERGDTASQLAQILGMKTGELPEGEGRPDGVDFLIIAGGDKAPATPEPELPEE
jgi:hypothetical protein